MRSIVILLLGCAACLLILGQLSSATGDFERYVRGPAALAQKAVELERDAESMLGHACGTLREPADGAEQLRLAAARTTVAARASELQAVSGGKIGVLSAELRTRLSQPALADAEVRRLTREIAQLAESERHNALARAEESRLRAKVTAWVLIALLALVGFAMPHQSLTEKRSHHVH